MKQSGQMNVVILVRGLTGGGVHRVIAELLKHTPSHIHMRVLHSVPEWQKETPFSNPNLSFSYVPARSKLFFDLISSFRWLRKLKPDAVIYPKNVIPFTHFLLDHKKYNIIYDLGYFENDTEVGYGRKDTLFMKTFMPASCRHATPTFAISQFSKDKAVTHFNMPPEDITVIPLGVTPVFFTEQSEQYLETVRAKLELASPFLFYAGSLSPRKNLIRVLRAFENIRDHMSHSLYITGIQYWKTEGELRALLEKHQDRVQMLGFLEENELVAVYQLADLYLFPSLYEGFGLPILEAQTKQTPVITSDRGSMKEVAGDSAYLVNPYAVEEIQQGITTLAHDETLKSDFIERGKQNIKRYSWERMADVIFKRIVTHDTVKNRT